MKKIRLFIQERPYSLLLGYWIFYILYFALLEAFAQPVFIIHSSLDESIPFNAYFIIPYLAWFPLLVIPLAYFLFHHKETFQNLCFFMFTGMTISLLIYTFLPNGLNLRVDNVGTGICAEIVRFLQGMDTPTNVCPSIHVSSTLAIVLVIIKYQAFKHPILIKMGSIILSILIILSTMFLKQHSIIDVFAGILLSLILYIVTYHSNWRKVLSHTFLKRAIS